MAAKSDKHLLEEAWVLEWRKLYRRIAKQKLQDFKPKLTKKQEVLYLNACPCCHNEVYVFRQKGLQNLDRNFIKATKALSELEGTTRLWFSYTQGHIFELTRRSWRWQDWVCDDCLTSETAEVADFENAFLLNIQKYGQIRPYFYFDHTQKCSTCQKEFVYTKSQQRWAHETFVIEYEARLNDCFDCRKKKNHQLWLEKTTQEAVTLARAEPTFENLFKASQILLGNADPRALDYLRRAKNKAPSLKERQKLEQQIRIS